MYILVATIGGMLFADRASVDTELVVFAKLESTKVLLAKRHYVELKMLLA